MFTGSCRKGLEFDLELADGLPDAAHGDPTRLRQILINLIGNAVKFTKQERIGVTAGLRASAAGETLHFAIIDDGIGIAAETLPKLFTDFTQADSSITREFEGTGLGLSICTRLVELMGGEIGVESDVGVGSTFWFTLPCAAVTSDVAEQSTAAGAGRTELQALRPLHILVAEDNEINRMIIGQVLDRFGHTFEMTGDGDEAVKAHEAKDFDLILMDVRMPKTSGPDATRVIREMAGGKATIPIIALAADAMVEQRAGYFEAGMDEVATKPIDRNELAAAINAVMHEDIHVPRN
ncbi:MAG: ATP-binding protein [Rhodospirillaceae bacterium]